MKPNIGLETLKVLAVESIDEAKSGHPGIALGAAPMMVALYAGELVATPKASTWINRDRFVLSAGHGSSLLYATLHLAGYKLSLQDLASFRQLNSLTPGHPEVHLTDGVDASSGPLGQGIAQAVGMAIAEAHLHAKFPTDIDHYTYALCGDGDLQEGISQEAMSLAGHLALNKLIVLFDSNDIQLDGPTNMATSEHFELRMRALNWNYLKVETGEDPIAIREAIKAAKTSNRPTLIECKTIIGWGASNQGTSSVHGSPLKHDEVAAMRASLGGERFTASREAYLAFEEANKHHTEAYHEWVNRPNQEPFDAFLSQSNHFDLTKAVPAFELGEKMASRVSSGKIMNEASRLLSNLIGGSADLTASTQIAGADGNFSATNRIGRNLKFGVREHAMAAICNGISLHGGLRPFCSGFFVFADYMKPSIRLASLMELPVIYIFTHDTIAVGEDGPTHQPIEQLTMLRSIPGLNVIRPADANEVRASYQFALKQTNKPTALILTRQDLVTFLSPEAIHLEQGAYVVRDGKNLDGIIIASGSEVYLAMKTSEALALQGLQVRVISMPSTNLFDAQSKTYQDSVLPPNITKRLAIEMSEGAHLWRYVGLEGDVVNINTFGKSAKGPVITEAMGFNVDSIVKKYLAL